MTADKQLKAYIDRVLRLKEEQDTLGDDIREVYADAKAEGYDKTVMGKLVAHLRKVAKSGADAVDEAECIFDTYLQAYHRASGTAVATHTHEEEFDPITGEFVHDEKPAMALQSSRQAAEAVSERTRTNPVANVGEGAISTTAVASSDPASRADEDSERQHSSTVGFADDCRTGGKEQSDASAAPVGDAAANAHGIPARSSSGESDNAGILADETHSAANTGGGHVDEIEHAATHQAEALVDEFVSATPGEVNYEDFPPVPMKRTSFAHCFPELSARDYDALGTSIAFEGVLEPVVRDGNVILDGWSRYNIARNLGIQYPVIEYDGDDDLLDVIRWQRAARNFTPAQSKKIAAELAKEVPHRASDIMAAFELEMEEA